MNKFDLLNNESNSKNLINNKNDNSFINAKNIRHQNNKNN